MFEKIKKNLSGILIGSVLVGGLLVMVLGRSGTPTGARNADDVVIPEYTEIAQQGNELFNEFCAACHGENAAGTDVGPTFLNRIYRAGHHPNDTFMRVPVQGARAHHWSFGDMPPVEGITQDQILKIVHYVRELQRANGVL
ncbi:MAG: c-type cytochrome [Hyphomicrobiales bacterium]